MARPAQTAAPSRAGEQPRSERRIGGRRSSARPSRWNQGLRSLRELPAAAESRLCEASSPTSCMRTRACRSDTRTRMDRMLANAGVGLMEKRRKAAYVTAWRIYVLCIKMSESAHITWANKPAVVLLVGFPNSFTCEMPYDYVGKEQLELK
eukprot:366675-Pleurochrysis_carterae.AAC.1